MFGLNWPELMIISVVALIVIGPEDLPKMFRELGRFTAKLRQMSREFSRAMEQAAKETGVSDVAKDLRNVTSAKSLGLDAVKDAATKFEKWDPLKNAAKPTAPMPARSLVPPPMPATVPMAAPSTGAAAEPAKPAVSSLTSVAERDAAKAEEDLDFLPSIEDEMAEDLADLEALDGAEPVIHGPATQALYDKAALRRKVMAEQTAKLQAIEAGTYQEAESFAPAEPAASKPEAKAAAKPKAKPQTAKLKAAAPEALPPDAEDKPKRSRAPKSEPAASKAAKAEPAAPKAAKAEPAAPKAAKPNPAAPKTPKKTRKSGEETA